MAAAILPAIQLGVGAFSAYKQHQAQKKAAQQQQQMFDAAKAAQDEAKAARGQITQQAPQFYEQGRQLGNIGMPLLQTTSNYYRALVGGDRGAMDAALAPDRAAITDTYRGAEKGITNLRGPTRDLARAELARSKAGALGLLPAQARRGAVEGAQHAGEYATSAGMDARSRGASLYESAAGLAAQGANAANTTAQTGIQQGYLNLAQGRQNYDMASGLGGLFGEVLKGILNRGTKAPIPTTGWTPPMSPYPSAIYGSR